MVFVKTLKRKMKEGNVKEYRYWALNQRLDGKIKVKLLRRLTFEENQQFILEGIKKPIDPIEGIEITEEEPKPIDNNEIQILKQWIQDIETGKLPNDPSMRPKAFIKKVLRPMLDL